jgi:hypothetical protein
MFLREVARDREQVALRAHQVLGVAYPQHPQIDLLSEIHRVRLRTDTATEERRERPPLLLEQLLNQPLRRFSHLV